jgi:hypothetical protein
MGELDPKTKYARVQDLFVNGLSGLGGIQTHNADETHRHLAIKTALAHIHQSGGRTWGTEVELRDRGVVDFIDLGPSDGRAVIYEIETSYSPAKVEEKVNQYLHDGDELLRDVIVIPARECPGTRAETREWLLETYVIGVDDA